METLGGTGEAHALRAAFEGAGADDFPQDGWPGHALKALPPTQRVPIPGRCHRGHSGLAQGRDQLLQAGAAKAFVGGEMACVGEGCADNANMAGGAMFQNPLERGLKLLARTQVATISHELHWHHARSRRGCNDGGGDESSVAVPVQGVVFWPVQTEIHAGNQEARIESLWREARIDYGYDDGRQRGAAMLRTGCVATSTLPWRAEDVSSSLMASPPMARSLRIRPSAPTSTAAGVDSQP